jgi:subtilisin
MLVLASILSLGCAPAPVIDAGDPAEQDAFDRESDSFWSDLADAGYDAVPGHYTVLMSGSAQEAPDRLRGIRDWRPALQVDGTFATFPAFTVEATYEDALELAQNPDVLAVEPDWLAFATSRGGSSCASSTSQITPGGIAALGTNAATGVGVTVAVLDTGVDTSHPDLAVAGGYGYTASSHTYVDDNGHGTHVSGTIAALNNTQGVVGVAPGVSLYAVKILDRNGSGSYSTIASGVDWAVANGMDVANMSLGGSSNNATLHTAITAAHNANVVVVVAAGNDGISATRSYPGAYDGEVLTVSAYDTTRSRFASWSDYGVPPIDVAAPGASICSTWKGSGYQTEDGTSMSAPHVSGAVAVYLQNHPGASFATVEAAIEGGATPLATSGSHTEDLVSLTSL